MKFIIIVIIAVVCISVTVITIIQNEIEKKNNTEPEEEISERDKMYKTLRILITLIIAIIIAGIIWKLLPVLLITGAS